MYSLKKKCINQLKVAYYFIFFFMFLPRFFTKMSVVRTVNLFSCWMSSLWTVLDNLQVRYLRVKASRQSVSCVCFCNCSEQSFGLNIITKERFCMGKELRMPTVKSYCVKSCSLAAPGLVARICSVASASNLKKTPRCHSNNYYTGIFI